MSALPQPKLPVEFYPRRHRIIRPQGQGVRDLKAPEYTSAVSSPTSAPFRETESAAVSSATAVVAGSSQHRTIPTDNRHITTSKLRPAKFTKGKIPVELQLLMLFQKASFGLALLSMASSMALYLATVRIPQLWSREYRNLETLQRQERQLTEINETLKYQMAREAKRKGELSSLKPDDAVFVSPAEIKLEAPANLEGDRRKKIAFKYATPGY